MCLSFDCYFREKCLGSEQKGKAFVMPRWVWDRVDFKAREGCRVAQSGTEKLVEDFKS